MATRSRRKLDLKTHDDDTNQQGRMTDTGAAKEPGINSSSSRKQCTDSKETCNNQQSSTTIEPDQSNMQGENKIEFEQYVRSTLEQILTSQKEMKHDFDAFKRDIIKTVEYQAEEIKEMQMKIEELETSVSDNKHATDVNKQHVDDLCQDVNRLERHSRRNNVRIVGYQEKSGENIEQIVEEILQDKFNRTDVCIERAHRDGRRRPGAESHPRHILVKFLSYRDKVDIMSKRREKLTGCPFFIVEDHTRADLEERKRYGAKVKELYEKGIKLRFVSGQWRDKSGKKASFYSDAKTLIERYKTGGSPEYTSRFGSTS